MKIEGACHPVISVCPFNKTADWYKAMLMIRARRRDHPWRDADSAVHNAITGASCQHCQLQLRVDD